MKQHKSASSSHIPWHPAFFQAIRLELEPYQDMLEFQSDYPLTTEPLQIDVVIVKKAPDLIIHKNIARIFKRVNLLEYKSPEDYFSVYDFYKVLSYAYLYASLTGTSMRDITITIVETRYPRELFKYLEEENCRVVEASPGIYSISGYPVTIQVIESKKLPPAENLWLKGLSNDLNAETARTILEESRKKGVEIGAYLHALVSANAEIIEEILEMAANGITIDEVLEKAGLAAKWEKRGEANGEARGEKKGWEKAIELLKQGYTVDQLEQMNPGSPMPHSPA
jgi:hypothetical protein